MDDLPDVCSCKAKLADDSQHFFSCKKLKRKAMTVRHDAIVRLLRAAFHHVGAVVHVEPRLYDTERVRPDLDILLPDQNVMLDVAVTTQVRLVVSLNDRWQLQAISRASRTGSTATGQLSAVDASSPSSWRLMAPWASKLMQCSSS